MVGDNTTITCCTTINKETLYMENIAEWCTENNLMLRISQIKEMTIDFRKKKKRGHREGQCR